MRLLMVEDDKDLCSATKLQLCKEGYEVDAAYDGDEGLYYMLEGSYDLILLDRLLPKIDGISLLNHARKKGLLTPVLMLTALGDIGNRVEGLDSGADDYLTKPFDMRELLARVRALTRRPAQITKRSELRYCDLLLDFSALYLEGNKGRCTLSKKEADILNLLIKNEGGTVSRSQLFSHAWGIDTEVEESILDTYVHFIRRRLDAVSSTMRIRTVRGVGYRLEEET